MDQAPARQVGQPGNAVVDAMVADWFEQAAARHNDAEKFREFERLLDEAEAQQSALHDTVIAVDVGIDQARSLRSSLLARHTLEDPWYVVISLVLVGLGFLLTWYYQRRVALLWAMSMCGLISIGLMVAAMSLQTAEEKANANRNGDAGPMTRAMVEADILHTAQANYRSQITAAQSARGLWQHGRIDFPTAVFESGKAVLKTNMGLGDIPLYGLSANQVTPGNLATTFAGPLIDVGDGEPEKMAGRALDGAVVVMSFHSQRRWLDAVQRGAKVVIFVEPDQGDPIERHQAVQKFSAAPLSIPRFYMRRNDWRTLQQNIGDQGEQTDVVIEPQQPGRWSPANLAIDWLLIPGTEPVVGGDTPLEIDTGRQLVHIQAYKDSASIVPACSPGATNAVNLVVLQRLLENFETNPPPRPVLLSVVNDHANGLRGEEMFAHYAFSPAEALWQEAIEIERNLKQRRFFANVYGSTPSSSVVRGLRDRTVTVGGQVLSVNKPVVEFLRQQRNVLRDRIRQTEIRLRRAPVNVNADQANQLEIQRQTMVRNDRDIVRLMGLFNRFGSKTYFDQDAARQALGEDALDALSADRRHELVLDDHDRKHLAQVFDQIAQRESMLADELTRAQKRLTAGAAIRRQLLWLTNAPTAPMDEQWDRQMLFERLHPSLPAVAAFTLDLGIDGDQLGFFHTGWYEHPASPSVASAGDRATSLVRFVMGVADQLGQEQSSPSSKTPALLTDTLRAAKGMPWQAHLGGYFPAAASVMHHYDRNALTLTTVQDARLRAFTPHDTTDMLDPVRINRLVNNSCDLLAQIVRSTGLGEQAYRQLNNAEAISTELTVHQLDRLTVNLADSPIVPRALIVAAHSMDLPDGMTMLGEVRRWPVMITNDSGWTMLRGARWGQANLEVFSFDPNFTTLHGALDYGEGERRFSSKLPAAVNTVYRRQKLITFEAQKIDLIGLTESLTLQPAKTIRVLDANSNTTPQHYGMAGIKGDGIGKGIILARDGSGSVFVEPNTRFKIRTDQGLAINTQSGQPGTQASGFSADAQVLSNLVWTGAHDLQRLSSERLVMLEDKGVIDEAARLYTDEAEQQLEKLETFNPSTSASATATTTTTTTVSTSGVESAPSDLDPLVMAEEARGLAYRAYIRSLSTMNDLIQAVVIFLALVIPFCFFVMKLITPFTDVNRQLAVFCGIFVIMAIVLRLVHPAFEIAAAPQMVVLAFVIMGMAMFVTSVLIGKFNNAMTQAAEQAQQSMSVDAAQGRLMGVAFSVGVNNMKRRRLRTTLTSATIVLVTFTMLSVISVRQNVDPARIRTADTAMYDGFVFTNSGMGAIDDIRLNRLRAQLGQGAQTVVRAWAQRQDRYGMYLPYVLRPVTAIPNAPQTTLGAQVLLGMEPAEDGFLGPAPLVAGRWFHSARAQEVILSQQTAAVLGINEHNFQGKTLFFQGRTLELVGLLDDQAMQDRHDLADIGWLPLLFEARGGDQQQSAQSDSSDAQLGTSASELPGAYSARPQDVAIMPIDLVRALPDSACHTLSVRILDDADGNTNSVVDVDTHSNETGNRPADSHGDLNATQPRTASQRAWAQAQRLIGFQDLRLHVGLTQAVPIGDGDRSVEPGQYAVAVASNAQVTGMLKIAIPTVLAATIIFNTMLGSVMERKREISIYNAIGLNPTHVMIFFVAESLVFGLVGSVSGYLIGQILSVLITSTGWLDLNLNYSSMAVMVVIFLTMGTVLLSTLYPAMIAARAAVPSGQRRWSAPAPDGDELTVTFPFSFDASRILGVCAYLRAFIQENTDASTGKFLAKIGPVGLTPLLVPPSNEDDPSATAVDSRYAYAMIYELAPAPFDLGVNQSMEVYACYDAQIRAHVLKVHLCRQSGERANWVAVNQPFLESLRKRLLGWRSQPTELQESYAQQGRTMFADARVLPTVGVNSSRDLERPNQPMD